MAIPEEDDDNEGADWRTEEPSDQPVALARARRGAVVTVRLAGKQYHQPVGQLERQQQLEMAERELEQNTGGNAETKRKHNKWKLLWEEAMSELGFPAENWFWFSVSQFKAFRKWAVIATNMASIDVFTTMLNTGH